MITPWIILITLDITPHPPLRVDLSHKGRGSFVHTRCKLELPLPLYKIIWGRAREAEGEG